MRGKIVLLTPVACDRAVDGGGDGVFAACHRYRQDWGIPVRLVAGAAAHLTLDLRAVDRTGG